jgi:hypothetical protein
VPRLSRVPVEPVPTTGDDDVVRNLTSSLYIPDQEKPITSVVTHTSPQAVTQAPSQEPSQYTSLPPSQEPGQHASRDDSQDTSREEGQEPSQSASHTSSQPANVPATQPGGPPAGRKGGRPAGRTAVRPASQQANLPGVSPAGLLTIESLRPRSIRKITVDLDAELGERLQAFKEAKGSGAIRKAVELGLDTVLTANGY